MTPVKLDPGRSPGHSTAVSEPCPVCGDLNHTEYDCWSPEREESGEYRRIKE